MILGIIGDDFTGSSDIANNLKKSGMQVSMFAGVPSFKNKASLTNMLQYFLQYSYSIFIIRNDCETNFAIRKPDINNNQI